MSRLFALVLTAAAVLLLQAAPAHAAPLVGFIGGIFTAVKGSLLLSALARVAASVVLSKLTARLGPKPRQPGIKREITGTGALNPASFVLGRYATAGVMVCPPYSQGTEGPYANAFLTYVVELSDVPGQTLEGLYIDGTWVPYSGTPAGSLGVLVNSGKYQNKVWINYFDGTQTTASAYLTATFGSHPERPWDANMVGRGICYALVTFLMYPGLWPDLPTCRFVLGGIPLYDPRKDSTVGGSGPHRWADRATWTATDNPLVMVYNIHRGISVAGHVWGGGSGAADLPLPIWFAAMNACDALVDNGAGGTEPAYRAGFEVFLNEEPAAVCEELLKVAQAQIADMGGRWVVQVNDGGLPVFSLDDDALIATRGGDRSPFPAPQDTFNAISANYPEPATQWESTPAPMVTNAAWEAADGGRLPVSVDYPAAPYAAQVQRLMRGAIAAERRFLTHTEVLPPEALALDVTDALAWTSARYGYAAKLFQLGRMTVGLQDGLISLSLRERDPADLAVPPGYYTPPTAVSGALVPGAGPLVQEAIGPVNPLASSVVIDSADTGWVLALGATRFDGVGVAGQSQFSGFIEVTLTGAAVPKPLFWRISLTSAGFGTVEASLRTDYLLPGELHRLSAAGLAHMAGPLTNISLYLSGRGLAAGEEIACTLVHARATLPNR